MAFGPLMILLLVLLLFAVAGSGYGYYSGGSYASPLGIMALLLLVGLMLWVFTGWGSWVYPPPVP